MWGFTRRSCRVNGEPYTSRGVRTVRGRASGNPSPPGDLGAGCLAYTSMDDGRRHSGRTRRVEPTRCGISGLLMGPILGGEAGTVQVRSLGQGQYQATWSFSSTAWDALLHHSTHNAWYWKLYGWKGTAPDTFYGSLVNYNVSVNAATSVNTAAHTVSIDFSMPSTYPA